MLSSCNNRTIQEDFEGKWFLCKIENNGVVTIQNVCPEIEFAKDGKGKITKPSKEEIGFTYSMSSESKKIIFSFDVDHQYFEGKEYFYKIYTKDNLEILELSSKDGTSKYTLSKEK